MNELQAMDMEALRELARENPHEFRAVPARHCVAAIRGHIGRRRREIRARHDAGESGHNTLRHLTALSDEVVKTVLAFGLAHSRNPQILMSRVAICALGGYGRGEMSPCSDLDVSLLFDSVMDPEIEALNAYLNPMFWDIGYKAGYSLHSVAEATALASEDPKVYTTYAQARIISGDTTTLGRLKLSLSDVDERTKSAVLRHVRHRERLDELPAEYRDVYALEPDVKENAGGLRDFHAGLWMVMMAHGPMSLDDMANVGHISPVEHLELLDGLNFIWRVRNELHFHTGRPEDRLSYALQAHVSGAFGYGSGNPRDLGRFMEDYYQAAGRVRAFQQIAARICDQPGVSALFDQRQPVRARMTVYHGQLCVDPTDKNWFTENPTRLMEVFWECARRMAPLSPATAHWVSHSLHLVNDEFRGSDVVRRYFLAICNRALQAGPALREAAKTGVLGAYLPEFAAIQGIIRYEDFHSSPVDEHTIRAVEALAAIPRMKGEVGMFLYRVLERIRDPHLLVLAILFHDLGKAAGEIHAAEGTRIAHDICGRMGLSEYDTNRVAFLVEQHMAMSNIAFYRDTDDLEVVQSFAALVKTDDLLRMLLLLTFADLRAVAPNVWTDWKGALLFKLFLKSERILTGRGDVAVENYLDLPKVDRIAEFAPPRLAGEIRHHLAALGERYLLAYSPDRIAAHMECLEEARATGLALRCLRLEETGMSEVVVCTRDRRGLFADIAGCFTALLVSVQGAALFTRGDGWVVDCFTVEDAAKRRALTDSEFDSFGALLRRVLMDGEPVRPLVERSRTKLFALQQSVVPVRTVVEYDNGASRTDTVFDILTGDRTGLLHDIAAALSAMGVDFTAAHIMTDVGRVRDAFYVRMNGQKIEDNHVLESIRHRLHEAVSPATAP